jgi:glycosyltransferase involved in cell wall biosynthesis
MLSSQMIQDVKASMAEGFDVIHLEQVWSAWLLPKYEAKSFLSVHYLASIDAENYRPKEWRYRLIFWLQKRTERALLKKIHVIKTCSNRLKEKIQTWYPEKKISSIPWGIDTNLYEYVANEDRRNSKTIVLIASINWLPGKLAALRLLNNLWPEIKQKNPDAKLQIVGWSARQQLKDYLHLPDVEILENVESTKPYFNQASLLLYAPERGSGMKIKILEAMLMGTPVVTNAEGIEGLPENIQDEFALVGETDTQLINHTHALLNDVNLQNKIRKAARNVIVDWCSPEKTVQQIIEQYNSFK